MDNGDQMLSLERKANKRHVDRRNWKKTNEQYVVRGTFYLDFSFAENWEKELAVMNDGKRGGKYKYPVLLYNGLQYGNSGWTTEGWKAYRDAS